jgi:hypothetical protein
MSHRAENRADNFANNHCTAEEREKAIICLNQVNRSRPKGISGYFGKLLRSAMHPSEAARIAKIRASLLFVDRRQTA